MWTSTVRPVATMSVVSEGNKILDFWNLEIRLPIGSRYKIYILDEIRRILGILSVETADTQERMRLEIYCASAASRYGIEKNGWHCKSEKLSQESQFFGELK